MTKNEFLDMIVFELFKDRPYGNIRHLRTILKDLLGCEYEDRRVTECFIKITNYQVKKYGHSLYSRDLAVRR